MEEVDQELRELAVENVAQKREFMNKRPTDTELTNVFNYIEAYSDAFRWMVVCSGDTEYHEDGRPRIRKPIYRVAIINEDADCENLSEPFETYREAQAEADRRNNGSIAEHLSRLSLTKDGAGKA
jgi:hypothetical protein